MLGVIPSNNDVKTLVVNGFDRVNGTNNTFDFIRQHGSALHAHNFSFDAASNEAVINQQINLLIINLLIGFLEKKAHQLVYFHIVNKIKLLNI